ncbi:MAG: NHLP bacteriocin export ABC transporter permease/ATPase subunit [Pseudomonadota bacterium]
MKENLDIFSKEGTPFETRGNRPLLLADIEKVFIVLSGQVDVFSVRTDKGDAVGPRIHLFRAKKGEALFGMNVDQLGQATSLMAVGGPGTSLVACARSRFIELAIEPTHSKTIKNLVEMWIDGLSSGIRDNNIFPRNFKNIEIGVQISDKDGSTFSTPDETIWVSLIEGKLRLMGREDWPEISGKSLFPLSTKAWLVTSGEALFNVIDMSSFLLEDPQWHALEAFHQFVLKCIDINRGRTEIAEQERLRKKGESDRYNLMSSFSRLGDILETKKEKPVPRRGEGEALLSACEMVGNALNIKVRSPSGPEEESRKTSLEDIARTSGFRIRSVILRDTWWRFDHGPLLAFINEGKQPVALIPISPRKYHIHDPVKGTQNKVTSQMADTLDSEAFCFYRPFPERPLTGADLLKFGFQGCSGTLATVVFMGIIGALLGLLTPIMTGIIFGTIIPEAARGQLMQISIILATSAVATVMFNVTKGIALLRIEGIMDSTVQTALWDRLIALPVPFFRNYTAGDLAKRAMGINQIRQILSGVTVNAILACLFSAFNLVLLFYYDWKLAIIGVGLSVFSILSTVFASYLIVNYQRQMTEIEGKISGMVLQFITGIAKLRVSGTEDRAFAEWTRNFAEKKKFAYKAGMIQNVVTSFNAAFPLVASMAIFAWVIWKSNEGGLSTGNFLAFNAAYGNFQAAMLQMAAAITTSLNIIPLYERIKPIIENVPESDETKAKPGELAGEIEVSNIYFRYNPDGPLILKDVSMQISPGEFIALVGGSGSGKSTLLRLLLGFDTQEAGTIYYDGKDLESIDIREVRRQMGVVLQNAKVMPGDIFKNIVGTSNLTLDDAWTAARMVGVDKDIEAMPMGMHTVVSAGGGTLSGGQRQRLIIARAIVRRPRILFFDEATSALDNHTQAIVSRSLEKLQVTRVVIAHRLSTIINADRIFVLQHGEILETGTYDELMALEGFFADLAKRQLA